MEVGGEKGHDAPARRDGRDRDRRVRSRTEAKRENYQEFDRRDSLLRWWQSDEWMTFLLPGWKEQSSM